RDIEARLCVVAKLFRDVEGGELDIGDEGEAQSKMVGRRGPRAATSSECGERKRKQRAQRRGAQTEGAGIMLWSHRPTWPPGTNSGARPNGQGRSRRRRAAPARRAWRRCPRRQTD